MFILKGRKKLMKLVFFKFNRCRPCAQQMNHWSTKYNNTIFLCICVESLDIARWFRQFTGMSMNALLDRDNLPNFRVQLGCSGFVIIDQDGRFVTTKSKAFLDYGPNAFDDVEMLLREHTSAFGDSSHGRVTPTMNNSSASGAITSLPKVGNEDMDKEHETLIHYLKILSQEKSKNALKTLQLEFKEHSQHEEQLMSKIGFGSL